MLSKELIKSIKNVLDVRIDYKNYGMLSTKKVNPRDVKLMYENKIELYFGYTTNDQFNGLSNVIVQNDKVVAKIERKYSSRKTNGMYKELKPKIILVEELQ